MYGAGPYLPTIVLDRPIIIRELSDGLYTPLTYLIYKVRPARSAWQMASIRGESRSLAILPVRCWPECCVCNQAIEWHLHLIGCSLSGADTLRCRDPRGSLHICTVQCGPHALRLCPLVARDHLLLTLALPPEGVLLGCQTSSIGPVGARTSTPAWKTMQETQSGFCSKRLTPLTGRR